MFIVWLTKCVAQPSLLPRHYFANNWWLINKHPPSDVLGEILIFSNSFQGNWPPPKLSSSIWFLVFFMLSSLVGFTRALLWCIISSIIGGWSHKSLLDIWTGQNIPKTLLRHIFMKTCMLYRMPLVIFQISHP